MSDSLNKFVLLERIELISKIGGGDSFNDKDRQVALYWVGELAEQIKQMIIEKPLKSGSTELCSASLQ
ncbi:hypothetical protein L7G72_09270 [Xenorhabdus bovienii]|uniref:hypothetical protein n=1 Tax=Xenorhabdus bovienii TaxID=40576 RepID=UPI001EE0408B|nr:hypothetical protein [Xenorhabdus bovienii]MCG3462037.1 hypothetical protein [Xenorhabdus bovienii]